MACGGSFDTLRRIWVDEVSVVTVSVVRFQGTFISKDDLNRVTGSQAAVSTGALIYMSHLDSEWRG
jgi:hypothetical protein